MNKLDQLKKDWNVCVKDIREYGDFPETLVQQVEDFWLYHFTSLINETISELEKYKRTDETQMSHDHTFDEALDLAITKLTNIKE